MRQVFVIGAMALALATAACGRAAEQKEAKEAEQKQAQQAPQTTQQAAQQAASGLEQMAKGIQAMAGGGSGDSKPVDPVSFHELQTVFPTLDGWTKEKPTGERMTSPFAYSQAEVRYTKGDASIELKIVDSGLNQLLLIPYSMFLTAGYEKETSDGYEKSAKVNGQPGWEKWSSNGKNGEVNAVVGKRYLVTIQGSGIEDTKPLQDAANKIDMNKLAALK